MRLLRGELLERARKAGTFQELLPVAIGVLELHPQRPILEIVCGPISTGGFMYPDGKVNSKKNIRALRYAIRELEAAGRNVFDTTPFETHIRRIFHGTHNPEVGQYRNDLLDVFFAGIYGSGKIRAAVFLPGSEQSKGCQWERSLFEQIGIPVLEYPGKLWEGKVIPRLP